MGYYKHKHVWVCDNNKSHSLYSINLSLLLVLIDFFAKSKFVNLFTQLKMKIKSDLFISISIVSYFQLFSMRESYWDACLTSFLVYLRGSPFVEKKKRYCDHQLMHQAKKSFLK